MNGSIIENQLFFLSLFIFLFISYVLLLSNLLLFTEQINHQHYTINQKIKSYHV